jgi:hypothetical protein
VTPPLRLSIVEATIVCYDCHLACYDCHLAPDNYHFTQVPSEGHWREYQVCDPCFLRRRLEGRL